MLIFTRSSTPLGTVSKKKERKFSIRVAGWVLDDPGGVFRTPSNFAAFLGGAPPFQPLKK